MLDLSMPYGYEDAVCHRAKVEDMEDRWACIRLVCRGPHGEGMSTMVYLDRDMFQTSGAKTASWGELSLTDDMCDLVSEGIRDGVGELRQRIRRQVSEDEW